MTQPIHKLFCARKEYWRVQIQEKNSMQTAKQAAKQIIDQVSDQASWDDIMYRLYVKQKIEKGLKAVEDKRTVSHIEAKKRLLDNAD